jgi:hypothetical protein
LTQAVSVLAIVLALWFVGSLLQPGGRQAGSLVAAR